MFDVGRVAIKVLGRNAGKYCVVVDKIDDNFVLVDGNVKRKRCNIRHLEPLPLVLEIKKDASTVAVHEAMKKANLPVEQTKVKHKKEKPVKKQGVKK